MTSNDHEVVNKVVSEDGGGDSTDTASITSGASGHHQSSSSSTVTGRDLKDLVCRLPAKLLPNGKKTRGRVKISMDFIRNRFKRQATFSKRKSGIMKKVTEKETSKKMNSRHLYDFFSHLILNQHFNLTKGELN